MNGCDYDHVIKEESALELFILQDQYRFVTGDTVWKHMMLEVSKSANPDHR